MAKVTIYGIHEDDYHCYSCRKAKKICEDLNIEYDFIRVLKKGPDGMPEYNLDSIDELVKKAKLVSRKIVYPIIFIDDQIARINTFPEILRTFGYDIDPDA